MQSLLKVSDGVNLAMHAAAILASEPGKTVSVKDLAHRLGASEATLSKAMQRMVRAGLARSTRGPSGGFYLAKEPKSIALKDIVEAVDGKLASPTCLFGNNACGNDSCMLGDAVSSAHNILVAKLESTTLDQVPISLRPEVTVAQLAAGNYSTRRGR